MKTGTARILANTESMERTEWLNTRIRGIGASEIAAVAGISPYKSAYEVYLDKIGELPPFDGDDEKMQWGLELEAVIAGRFAKIMSKKTDFRIYPVKYVLQHAAEDWMLCNLDFGCIENGEEGVLEIKTSGEMAGQAWFDMLGDVTVPDHYLLQVQHQLAVTGFKWAYIACLIGGQRLIYKKIERDDEAIQYLLNIGKRFWNENVIKKVAPAMMGLDGETETLKRKYRNSKGTEIDLPLKAAEFLSQRENAAKEIKFYETIRDAAENEIRLMMGENEIGYAGDKTVKMTKISKWLIDSDKLKSEQNEIYEKYKKLSEYRRLYISKK